nr:uncharacterized protein LOC123289379 isoform X2 [Equus asinus]
MGIIFQRVQSPPRNLPRVERKERETAEAKALQCPFPSLPTPVVESQGLLRVGCAHLWLQEEAGSDPYLKHRETQDSGYGEAETQGETILRSLEEGPGLLLPHLSPPCPHQESTGARGMWVDRMDHVMALTPQNHWSRMRYQEQEHTQIYLTTKFLEGSSENECQCLALGQKVGV